jgi:hypothetical protein
VGYADVHCNKIKFLFFSFFTAFTARLRSLIFANPFEIIMGFFVLATAEINGISVISGEAILYAGQFNFSNKFKLLLSKTDANIIIFFFYNN